MEKKRKTILPLLLILVIGALFISQIINNKALKAIVSSVISLRSYADANEITSLEKPDGLEWKEGSTATATWNVVENANYYIVNVFVYDNGSLIGTKETGTSTNEIDLQQELYDVLQNKNLNSYQISFNVKAQYIIDDKEIDSEFSDYSETIYVDKKSGIKLTTPTNVGITDNIVAKWKNISEAGYYQVEYTIKHNNKINTYTDLFVWKTNGTVQNEMFEVDLTDSINNAYKYYNYDGEAVEISFRVLARSSVTDSTFIDGDYSVSSNTIIYSKNISKLTIPTNVGITDNMVAKWTDISEAGYYQVEYTIKYNNKINTYTDLFVWKTNGTVQNEMFEVDLTDSINNAYKYYNYAGETVEISFRVLARSSATDNNHTDGDYSVSSNTIIYSKNISELTTPTNVGITDNMVAKWTNISEAGYYQVEYTIKYNNRINAYTDLFVWKTNGTVQNEMFEVDLTDSINNAYKYYKYTGETVEISFRVLARSSATDNNHTDGDYSAYSNSIFYNPNGSTVINNINLAPASPVIAVGRSIYIGKTINPSSALYSTINWNTSNNNIVTISNMGQITGIKPGKATITAQVNSAIQSAEVNVYEIKSNVNDSTDSQNIIDEANEVIESVVTQGDVSNTDITDENKETVLNEIETGAKDGDMFNVDMKFRQSTKERLSELKDEINVDYSGYSIAGANNINIEISHGDDNGVSHHITNITELENEVGVTIDLSNSIPVLSNSKTREYKLVRKHNDTLENIDFEINNGIVETSSDKFSEFILLYIDTDIPATGINVNKENTIINVGETETINIAVLPENAANRNYISTSSKESVATVENNVITAVAPGSATITFTSIDGSYSKTVIVTVKAPLKKIFLNKTTGTKNVGEIEFLTVNYNPADTTDDKTVTWKSSNESIATVDNAGKVTAKAIGEATITATVGDKIATYKIDVKLPLTSISLNKTIGTLIVEEQELLTVTYNPSNTTDDKTIKWTTSDAGIATVEDGYVNAISAGDVTIKAIVGDKTVTYELTVIPRKKLTSISLNITTGKLNIGQEQDLVVTYNPTDTNDDKTITWITSNAAIATVNNGKVKAISPGQATITAAVGDRTANYIVDVKSPLVSINLNKTSGTLRVEGTETLTVTYNPSNTTDNKAVIWASSDTSVAKVENGKITALKVGECTITATVGDKIVTYNLTVIEKETLQGIFIEKGTKIKNNFVHGFKLNELLTNIKNEVGLEYTTIGDTTVIATGVLFKYNSELLTAVVYGDLNGDGKINSADLLKMRQHLLGTNTLTGSYKEAGSIATGTTINSADLLRIRQHLLGQKAIEQ